MKNYYKILNVKQTATDNEIKTSYRQLAKRFHPDVNPGNTDAARKFADINEAYNVLSDSARRAAFDTQLRQEAIKAQAQAAAQARARAGYARSGKQIILTEAQLTAQIQAQVQYQVQSQLTAVRDSAYKEGYNSGYVAGYNSTAKNISSLNGKLALLAHENDRLKKNAETEKAERAEIEQELFDRDRLLAQNADRLHVLETQLQWMRRATATASADPLGAMMSNIGDRAAELSKEIAKDDVKIEIPTDGSALIQHTRRKQIKEELDALDLTLKKLSKELAEIDANNARKKKLAEIEEFLSSAETHAADWAKKLRADRRLAKPTLYGTLGVLIWATDDEIASAYEKLNAKYSAKTGADSAARLQKIRDAYSVIGNPKRRKEYNASIGCTDAKIEHERKLIKENEGLQSRYRNSLAGKAWWVRFDELSSMSLAGDADAQNALGELYYNGQNIDRDPSQAVYWFREAFLHSHHPDATYNLGLCYLNGDGVHPNKIIANSLFRQAEILGCKKSKPTD